MNYSKEMREAAGLTQRDISRIADIATAYVSQLETGKRSASSALDAMLCSICKNAGLYSNATQQKRNSTQNDQSALCSQTIPVVAMAAAAHFDPALSNLCDLWECSEDRIACACAHADELFGVRISGDSMSPTLCDGDVVAVSDRLPATGDTCIALHRTDGILCKRWYWRNGIIRLESINPEGRTYQWTKAEFAAENPLTWRFKVEALIYRKL